MIKVNKLDYEDILSYMEFMDKYGSRLKEEHDKGELSQELIDNMTATMIEHIKDIESYYIRCIEDIYTFIIDVKYVNYPDGIPEGVPKLVSYIVHLKGDRLFDDMDVNKLCSIAYNNLKSSWASDYLNGEMDEEFKPKYLLDIDYQLNNLKKYCTDEYFLRDLDSADWRMLW